MSESFQLLLFADSIAVATAADAAGIDGVVVDWECRGKSERQSGYDTQINRHTIEHLRRVRSCTGIPVTCRINGYGVSTAAETASAIDAGADEILLPMVRTREEVERTLDLVRGRCAVGILVETVDAVRESAVLGRLPLSRVFVGLNDLSIDRGGGGIFAPLVDGTIDAVRRDVAVPFGFGGLTLPDRGSPVPCQLLIAEMARLRCSFSFLRRSFLRDVPLDQFDTGAQRIRAAIADAQRWSDARLTAARSALSDLVPAWT